MKKAFLRVLVITVAVGLLAVLSLTGCKTAATEIKVTDTTAAATTAAATTAAETAAAETTAAKGAINIGILAVTSGAFAQLGQDSIDGVNLAFDEIGFTVAGRDIKLFIEGTDITPESAIDQMRAAADRDKCQIVLGPLSGSEGLAVKNSADEWPNTTIIVAASAAEDITMRGIKDNVYRSSFNGTQPMFPFGIWAYEQGYKKIVTIGEDYDYPYAQVGGFLKTFTESGGEVVKKYWVPIGTSDYSAIVADIPKDIDAIYATLSGTDIVNFLTQMKSFGLDVPILGGTVAIDSGTLTTIGEALDGVVSGSIWTGSIDRPGFVSLDEKYVALRGRPAGLFTGLYFRAAQFAIKAIEAVNGNIEDQQAFRTALQGISFEDAVSSVSFDEFHQCVMDVFINQVKNVDGEWRNVPIKTYPQVSQFWTYDPIEYQKLPSLTKESIDQMYPSTSN
jgi:branched-chain amino acid transport system substrate-binding protein